MDKLLIEEANNVIKDKQADYYIISKDKGYNSFIEGKRKSGFRVSLSPMISEANDMKKEELVYSLRKRLKNKFILKDEEYEQIAIWIMNSDSKSALNENLQKMFYNRDVKYIFENIKDITYQM